MIPPAVSFDEDARVAALKKLGILDTSAEERFDRITRLAAHLLKVPIALISLVDDHRQWFKSRVGLEATETPRDISFCGHAILKENVFMVPDALADVRFQDNPLVTGEPRIRFYAGQPLKSTDGHKVGTLCVIDRVPRALSAAELQSLQDLARMAEQELGIQDLREATTRLSESERWLRTVLSTTGDGIISMDSDGVIRSANAAAGKLLGYSSEELVGSNVSILMPDHRDTGWQSVSGNDVRAGEDSFLGVAREVVATRKDGTLFPMELVVHKVGESPKFSVAIMRDLTERHREQSERNRFFRFFSLPMNLICLAGFDGYFKFLSDGWQANLGYSKQELLSRPFEEFVHPDDRQPTRDELQRLSQGSPTFTFENRYLCKDGSIKWLLWNAEIVPEESLIYAVARDITPRKIAEQNAREAKEKLDQLFIELSLTEAKTRALLQAIPDMMLRINKEGNVLEFLAQSENVFGLMPAEMVGRSLEQIVPLDLARLSRHFLAEALRTRSIQIFEYSLPYQEGVFDFEARVVVSGPEEVLAIIRDIRERKEADRMKSEFVSIVSHELRTPLTSILGSLELMSGGVLGEIPPEAAEMVEISYFNADRLLHLINDILDMEKIESGTMSLHLQHVELLGIIRKSVAANQAYGVRYKVVFEMKETLPGIEVNVDEDRIIQVLSNLLSNAAKFSPAGSSVDVNMVHVPDGIRVKVTDRGPGIPDELRKRMFQKFAQADSSDSRKKGGTGLGLSISKAIVERHGGRIGFEPASPGTTFYFDLPVVSQETRKS